MLQIEDHAHLVHLCRYIHANPVAHGLVEAVEEWAYSNYPEWVELRAGTLVDRAGGIGHNSELRIQRMPVTPDHSFVPFSIRGSAIQDTAHNQFSASSVPLR